MPEWVDKWMRIGLSCEPADWETAEAGVRGCYAAAKIPTPSVLLRMGSPFGAVMGGILAVLLLRGQVRSQVRSQVWSQVESQYRGGQLWAGWYAYVSFFRDVCRWHDPVLAAFAWDEAVARSASWWWLHDDVCAISDRPETLHRDAQGRLHHTSGPALAYRDGWALWVLHGVRVPQELVLRAAEDLDPRVWVANSNAEIRREAVRKIGIERVCATLGASVIAHGQDHAGQPCELVNLDLGDGRRRPYLKLRSVAVPGLYHLEGVPPATTTIAEALAFRNETKEIPLWLR